MPDRARTARRVPDRRPADGRAADGRADLSRPTRRRHQLFPGVRRRAAAALVGLLGLLAALAVPAAGTAPAQAAPASNYYTGSDGAIFDLNHNRFVVKGVNVNGPRWPWSRETTQDVSKIVDTWRFNTVRVAMYPRLEYNGVSTNMDLDTIVNAFTSRGIVTILENHDFTGKYPRDYAYVSGNDRFPSLQEEKDFWTGIATKYKSNPRVWFNLLNEPGTDGLSISDSITRWDQVHRALIDAVRGTGARNLIVLDDHDFGQANGIKGGISDSAVLTRGQALDDYDANRIVYAIHVYTEWGGGTDRFDRYFATARDRGLPVIIGEFGATNGAEGSAVAAMFNKAVQYRIGRIVWSWDSRDAYDLTWSQNGSGWEIDRVDGNRPGNLRWVGGLVWDDNRGSLSTPVVSPFPLLTNGGFENGMTAWNDWGGASAGTPAYSGSRALQVASGAAGGAGQFIALDAGTTYRLSGRGRNSAATGTASAVGVKYQAPGSSTSTEVRLSFTTSSWEWKSTTFTTPSGTPNDPLVFVWKADAGVGFSLDDVNLERL